MQVLNLLICQMMILACRMPDKVSNAQQVGMVGQTHAQHVILPAI